MTQRERLLRLLDEHAAHWVELPRILELRIAQYSARILELRRELEPKGYRIESRVIHSNRRVRSWFRLLPPNRPSVSLTLGESPPGPQQGVSQGALRKACGNSWRRSNDRAERS